MISKKLTVITMALEFIIGVLIGFLVFKVVGLLDKQEVDQKTIELLDRKLSECERKSNGTNK